MVKLLRRTGAVFLAIMALWCLSLVSPSLLSLRRGLAVEALKTDETSTATHSSLVTPDGWVRLLMGQSPYLRAGYVLRGHGSVASAPNSSPSSVGPDILSADDDGRLLTQPSNGGTIVAQTFLPSGGSDYLSSGGVFLYNRTPLAVDMEKIAALPITLTGTGAGPQILIVHTHATESYTQDPSNPYRESDPYRTTDYAHNIVRVGDEMAAAFAQAGLNVLHDRTLHDYPAYSGAYTRSFETVQDYLMAYPSISVVLDVHRDALIDEDGTVYKAVTDTSVMAGAAQVMLVVGTDADGTEHPKWQQNLAFAIAMERVLNRDAPTLARPLSLRPLAYNQQLSPGSLLVEVGTHGNTLDEALTAARVFAQTVAPLLRELLPNT